jgi:hypothetical protein
MVLIGAVGPKAFTLGVRNDAVEDPRLIDDADDAIDVVGAIAIGADGPNSPVHLICGADAACLSGIIVGASARTRGRPQGSLAEKPNKSQRTILGSWN